MKIKNFNKKTIQVRDYPDQASTITIYGSSKKSKFKFNDDVVLVNNCRVGFKKDTIIGFDKDGDAILKNCAWNNTKGGYDDSNLTLYKNFKNKLNNLSVETICTIEKKINEHYNFFKKRGNYAKNKKVEERIKNNYVSENWQKLD